MMCSKNTFLLKIILLLWFFCAVLCMHQKRDVHRIIIQESLPRNQKKGHLGSKQGHNHGAHSHRPVNKNHHGHGHKKGKKPQGSFEEHANSYEDNGSYSRENSYDSLSYSHNKGMKTYQKHHKRQPSRPSYTGKLAKEETRRDPYRDDSRPGFTSGWVPLNNDQKHQHPYEPQKNKYRQRKEIKTNKNKQHSRPVKQYHLEITTAFPLQYELSTLYPQFAVFPGTFSDFNLNEKFVDSNQSPLIGTMDQMKFKFSSQNDNSDRLKNHRSTYDINEADGSQVGTLILVPDNASSVSSEELKRHESGNCEEEKGGSSQNRSRRKAVPRLEDKKDIVEATQ